MSDRDSDMGIFEGYGEFDESGGNRMKPSPATLARLNGWEYDLGVMPVNEPYLVYLVEPVTGTHVHVAINLEISNGHLFIVGGNMAHDMPPILFWRLITDLPKFLK